MEQVLRGGVDQAHGFVDTVWWMYESHTLMKKSDQKLWMPQDQMPLG
jgi:hypothetical protein